MINNLPVSPGWVFLICGFSGIVTSSLAKTFSWRNSQFLGTEEDRKTETPMTPLKRSLIIGFCLVLAIYGAFRIQQDDNWNPIQPGARFGGPMNPKTN